MGEPRGWAKVRVDKYLEGAGVKLGVPVKFRPVIDLPEGGVGRRTGQNRKPVTANAPISHHPDSTQSVELHVGTYDIEAILPSGELLRGLAGSHFDPLIPWHSITPSGARIAQELHGRPTRPWDLPGRLG